MIYKFLYNGKDITDDVEIGANVSERLSELLDIGSMSITFSKDEEPFQMFGLITIEIKNDDDENLKTYDMYIVQDDVEPATKDTETDEETGEKRARFYNHDIKLMELTHALDYSVVNMLTFTQPIIQDTDSPFDHRLSTDNTERWAGWTEPTTITAGEVPYDDGTGLFIHHSKYAGDFADIHGYAQMVEPMERLNIPNLIHSDNIKISKKDKVKVYSNVKLKDGHSFYRKGYNEIETQDDENPEDAFKREISGSHEVEDPIKEMTYEYEERPTVELYKKDKYTGLDQLVSSHVLDDDVEFSGLEDGQYSLKYYIKKKIPTPISYFAKEDVDEVNSEIFWDSVYVTNYTEVIRSYTHYFTIAKFERYTMYDFVQRIINTTPLTTRDRIEGYKLFNINPELEEKMKEVELPQLFLEKMTVRRALNVGFAYMNAVVRLERENDELSLNANFFNERDDYFNFSIEDAYAYEKEQSTKDYATSNRSFMNNTVNTHGADKPSVVEYGEDTYKGLRSDSVHILPNEAKLKLEYPIYRLISVTVKIPIELPYFDMASRPEDYTDDNQGVVFRTEYLELDITSRVLEENVYNIKEVVNDVMGGTFDDELLSSTGSFYRNTRIENVKYRYGGKEIDFSGQVGQILPRTKQAVHIGAALTEQLQYRMGEKVMVDVSDNDDYDEDEAPFFFAVDKFHISAGIFEDKYKNKAPVIKKATSLGEDYTQDRTGEQLDLANVISDNLDFFQNMSFKVKYITIDSEVLDSEREDTDNFKKEAVQTIKQGSQIISFERAGLAAFGLSQRLGVPGIGYSKITTRFDDIEDVRDYNQHNQIIVERENILQRDYVDANLTASRDFNRLQQFIGVDRTYRPYEVPQQQTGLKRDDIYKEYIEYYSKDTDGDEIEESDYPQTRDKALDTIINTIALTPSLPSKPVSVGLVKTDGFEKIYNNSKFKDTPEEDYFDSDKPFALLVPVKSKSTMGALSFTFGWDHNIIAGDRAVPNWTFGDDIEGSWFEKIGSLVDDLVSNLKNEAYGIWRELIEYTDVNGVFNYLHFRLLDEFKQDFQNKDLPIWEQTRNLPLVQSQTTDYFSDHDDNILMGTHTEGYANAIAVYKDPAERYNLTYQISITPKHKEARQNIIFGKKFFDENLLVYGEIKDKLFIYKYTEDEPKYRPFDISKVLASEAEREEFSNPVIRTDYGFRLNEYISLSGYTHWAVGDEDGNLYLAVNNTDRYIYFERRYSRSDIESLYNFELPPVTFADVEGYGATDYSIIIEDEDTININDTLNTFSEYEFGGFHIFHDEHDYLNTDETLLIADEEPIALTDGINTFSETKIEDAYNISDTAKGSLTADDSISLHEEDYIELQDSLDTSSDVSILKDTNIDVEESASINETFVVEDGSEAIIDITDTLDTSSETTEAFTTREITDETETTSTSDTLIVADEDTITITDIAYTEIDTDIIVEATEWDYIGTSGNEDNTVNAGVDDTSCQTYTEIKIWLTNNYPPEDYNVGFVMAVAHSVEDNGALQPCTTYYYKAVQ